MLLGRDGYLKLTDFGFAKVPLVCFRTVLRAVSDQALNPVSI